MLGKPPKEIEREGVNLAKGWLEVCEEIELEEYLEKHASPEYMKYHNETIAHIDEMERRGIFV